MLLEKFDLSNWVLGTSVVAFVLLYLFQGKTHKNLPPGPRGWPVFGHLYAFIHRPQLFLEIAEMVNKYGNVIRFNFGPTYVFVLNGYDTIKEALVEKAEYFSERPSWMYTIKAFQRDAGIVFNSNNWRERRRFALVSMRDFGLGKRSLEERMKEEANYLLEEIEKTNGEPVNLSRIFPFVTGNIICSIIRGERFPLNDSRFEITLDALNIIATSAGHVCPQNFVPWFKSLPTARFKPFKKGSEHILKTVRKWQMEHEDSFDPDNIRDLIDLFIAEKRKPGSTFQDLDLVGCVTDLFLAGTETTSTTLSWALAYLINYPEIQKKCREEIWKEFGNGIIPEYKAISKLPYVNAVLNEVQRLGNIAPFSLWRATSADVELGGYTLPKGSIIMPNMHTVLRDKKYWDDPDAFKPERWLRGNKVINIPGFIPFSTGKRVCLGEQLAKKEIFIFMTSMLQEFKFMAEDESNPPCLDGIGGVVHAPQRFSVRAVKL